MVLGSSPVAVIYHFLLLVIASVAANHKTTTEADVLNKIAGQNEEEVHKVVHEEVRSCQNWCWGRSKMIRMNETEYLNTCEYGPHYAKMVHTMAPRSNFALTSPINIQVS